MEWDRIRWSSGGGGRSGGQYGMALSGIVWDGVAPYPTPYHFLQPTTSHHVLPTHTTSCNQEFYLSLRKKQRGGDTVPITSRQLESLIRLAEARARMVSRFTQTYSPRPAAAGIKQPNHTAEGACGRCAGTQRGGYPSGRDGCGRGASLLHQSSYRIPPHPILPAPFPPHPLPPNPTPS